MKTKQDQQALEQQLKDLGLTPGTIRNYLFGFWAIPTQIRNKLKEVK